MVETAQGLQTLFGELGFPVALVVILLVAMWYSARAVGKWVEAAGAEAQARELRMATRLDEVQKEMVALLNGCRQCATTTVDKNTKALDRTTAALDRLADSHQHSQEVMDRVDQTLRDVRRQLQMGSGPHPAVVS